MKEFRKRIGTHHHEQQKRLRPGTKKNKRLKPQKQIQSSSKSPISSYWDLFYYLGIGIFIAFAPSVKGQTISSTRNNQNNSSIKIFQCEKFVPHDIPYGCFFVE